MSRRQRTTAKKARPQALKRLLRCTLERTEEDEMEGLNFIREQLRLVQFRKHEPAGPRHSPSCRAFHDAHDHTYAAPMRPL